MSVNVVSQLPAKILSVSVAVGDQVTSGQEVAVIESMKMEIPVVAECDGVIESIAVNPGDNVEANGVIVVIG